MVCSPARCAASTRRPRLLRSSRMLIRSTMGPNGTIGDLECFWGGRCFMLCGRKYRVEFTLAQAEFAERVGGICRSVWNTGLEQRRVYRKRGA
ncbi:helix-turn-helix domain-containing protein, partial [Nonomuraea wenchangensis]